MFYFHLTYSNLLFTFLPYGFSSAIRKYASYVKSSYSIITIINTGRNRAFQSFLCCCEQVLTCSILWNMLMSSSFTFSCFFLFLFWKLEETCIQTFMHVFMNTNFRIIIIAINLTDKSAFFVSFFFCFF